VSELTQILQPAPDGDSHAAQDLLPLVYAELRRLANAKMSGAAPETLQPTALVHEAWLKLSGSTQHWKSREHFFRAAAQAMRQILIDRARAKQTLKRGTGHVRVNWDQIDIAANAEPDALLSVDEALEKLAAEHPDKAELVKLRFYTGLTIEETAAVLSISEKTVKRQWTHARALLFQELTKKHQ
jgi:RNA polymerase sigma factor (TIGR02999 family)